MNRSLSLTQATAINMIDMVGIGPFVVMCGASGMVAAAGGPVVMAAWVMGAILALCDGAVWAQLGARWPEAGGSYVFLQKLFPGRGGRIMPFLFTWQTCIQAPLVMASAAIGFASYLQYLIPMEDGMRRIVSGGVVLAMIALLYRDIRTVGRLGVVLWIITGGTLLWVIVSGFAHFNPALAFDFHLPGKGGAAALAAVVGSTMSRAVYSYLGYYNVCHLGGEISNPTRNIPRAIFLSVGGITVLYLCMQTALLGVLPTADIIGSEFTYSLYFERLYSPAVAKVATGLILCVALASLFSVMLGYSRIPYAAAKDGQFFPVFARTHPRKDFPHISLLALGGLAFIFSLLFKMGDVIKAIVAVRILIQFASQGAGLLLMRRREARQAEGMGKSGPWPWKMPLYPAPVIIALGLWGFLFFKSGGPYMLGALAVVASGLILYFLFLDKPAPPVDAAKTSPIAKL